MRKLSTTIALAMLTLGVTSHVSQVNAGCHSSCHRPMLRRLIVRPRAPVPTIAVRPIAVARPAVAKPVPAPLPSAPVGSVMTVPGADLGLVPGQVVLVVGPVKLQLKIVAWNPKAIQVQLPPLTLAAPAPAQLQISRGDGSAAPRFAMKLTPPPAAAPVNGPAPVSVPVPANTSGPARAIVPPAAAPVQVGPAQPVSATPIPAQPR